MRAEVGDLLGQERVFSPIELADLIAVHETGSMGKAAELNGRTKPAVSMAISRLERTVGFEILDRPSWTVKFTDRGEALVVKARAVMAELEAFSKLAAVLATGVEPQVAIAIDQAVPQELWSSVVAKVVKAYPDTKVELITTDGASASGLLRSGRAQVAMLIDNTLHGTDCQLSLLRARKPSTEA
ncbi:MAG: LysR family transcriptional regulator [Oxalobacteraceae bacterium]|nr:MAG: LysR family transcriptional regulator [Oxalobacteraceae bacterium]